MYKVLFGWRKRCERNNVMDYVGVSLKHFLSFKLVCLAGGNAASATMLLSPLVFKSFGLGGGRNVDAPM